MKRSVDDAPARILGIVTDALAQLSGVRRVVSFGSVATGRHDQWSDVDMLVVCDQSDCTCWRGAAVIRKALPILFYRKFSSREQPSGRYWFREESPMNRLDVSFETEESFADIKRTLTTNGHDLVLREEYVAESTPAFNNDEVIAAPWACCRISPEETEIGRCLYRALEAIKAVLRGDHHWKWDRTSCVDELVCALQRSSRTAFAGGDLRTLAEKCHEMNAEVERRQE